MMVTAKFQINFLVNSRRREFKQEKVKLLVLLIRLMKWILRVKNTIMAGLATVIH